MLTNLDIFSLIQSFIGNAVQRLDFNSVSDVSAQISKRLRFENREDYMKFSSCLYTYTEATAIKPVSVDSDLDYQTII